MAKKFSSAYVVCRCFFKDPKWPKSRLEEAAQKITVMEHATAAQEMSQEAGQNMQSMRNPQARAVQTERRSWEKVVQGLTEVRTVLAQIEESERQRGVST